MSISVTNLSGPQQQTPVFRFRLLIAPAGKAAQISEKFGSFHQAS
jgi:hypothetical protein